MVTRFRVKTNSPTQCLSLYVSSVSSLHKSYQDAFNDPNWQNAINDEYHALIKNNTWTLVSRPTDANIVHCMWLFCHNYLVDGTLSRYKAHLMANGSTQLEGVDVVETFSPVVKTGDLSMGSSMPPRLGFSAFHLILRKIITSLHLEFSMIDLGSLNYFLGISVTRDSSGMFLSQKKYAVEILERAYVVHCNPSRTPVDTESKLGIDVQKVCLYMHDPSEPHFLALKRILLYVLERQPTLSRSSAEAEYRVVANAVA
uniref:Ribonuclease H-like domain-containing protein n=1 Tax=Tanacetum cinerariifolium TaxID=118510 RepID=A0A6L2MTS1_TANCI|nr:ribonuclease H-like domain-containing protein [Tanacetum cinerariifolium]